MDTIHRRFGKFLVTWFVVVLAFFAWINVLGGKDVEFTSFWRLSHPFYIGLLYSTLAIAPVMFFARPVAQAFGSWGSAVGRACWALALAPVCFGLGSAVWFYYNTCTRWGGSLGCAAGNEVPYPSWADAGYLALLPFLLLALASLSKVLAVRGRDLITVAGAFIGLFVPTALLTWNLSFGGTDYGRGWLFDSESPGFFEAIGIVLRGDATSDDLGNLISGIYVITDVVLLATALVLIVFSRRVAGGLFFRPVVAVAAACTFQYSGDMVFFQRVFDETYYNGDGSDLLYFLAMFTLVTSVYLFGSAYRRMTSEIATPRPASAPAPGPAASEGVA